MGFDTVAVTAFFNPAGATFGGRLLGDYMSIAVKPGLSSGAGSVVGTTGVQLFP